MAEIFASKTAEIEEREVINAQISRKLAGECMVLLENDGALPIHTKKVALFGNGARATIKGGTGSGDVNTRNNVNIEQGFQNAGIEVTTTAWLDRQEQNTSAAKAAYVQWMKEEAARKQTSELAVMFDHPYKEPDCEIITINDIDVSETDTAVYVIARNSGEGADRFDEEGDYRLYPHERGNIHLLAEVYDKLIVVLNIGGVMDLSEMRSIAGVNAILLMTQLGNLGGDALLDVLTGKVNPSGKTTDTWAENYMDYPSSAKFSHNESVHDEMYEDGIYVGYRYFETFAPEKVQFEFGFGLSYTTFDIETVSADADDEKITLEVKVTNTGDKFSGKEVVQVYYEAPQGALGQPARQLCAYEKTENLAPGQSQTLKITFDINGIASYDDSGVTGNKSCYVLEAGDYNFYVGNSVKNNKLAYTYKVEELKVTEQLSEAACPNDENLTLIKPGKRREDGTYEITYVPSQKPTVDMAKRIEDNLPKDMKITGDVGITLQDVKAGKNTIEEFVAQLTVAELAQIVRGEGMSNPRVTTGTASAFGGLSDTLFAYGIPAACCADGPSGLRMEGKATQLPIGTALSASWNPKLVRELYTMEGQELYENQVDTLLGPGVNIHRHPLNGRNFEYYSEDPYLSGTMSVASTGGIKDGGAWGTIKHFALNGQESHRFKIDAVCSERAIRQIYLKSFEMAVKAGTVKTLMTAYNPINGHWAASNYDLCTTILRNEWGYDGIVMTDWWAKMNDVVEGGEESNQDTRDMVRSQNDVYMVVNNNGAEINSNNDNTEESIKEGRLTIGELQRAAINICNFILSAPVIERELVDTDVAKHYDSVPNDQAKYEVFNIEKDNKVMFNSGAEATLEVEDEGEYTIIVNISFDKSNLSQSTVNVNANGTTMVVIQTNGTDGNWITQKLCKVKLDKGVYNLKLEEVLAGIKVKYIQFKKIPKKNK